MPTPPRTFFGEQCPFEDGTYARTYATTKEATYPGVVFDVYGSFQYVDGPLLIEPAGCVASDGHRWISANGAIDPPMAHAVRDDGLCIDLPNPYGSRTIIRRDDLIPGAVLVAYTDVTPGQLGKTWRTVRVSPLDKTVTLVDSGVMPEAWGGMGMRGWDASGTAVPTGAIDTPRAGLLVRALQEVNGFWFGLAAVQGVGQILMGQGETYGTLSTEMCAYTCFRISNDGRFWSGVTYTGERIQQGVVPTSVPPLVLPPLPAIVVPAIPYPAIAAPFKAWNDRSDYGRTDPRTNGIVLDTVDPASIPLRKDGRPRLILGDTFPSTVPDAQFIGHFDSLEGGVTDEATLDAFVAQIRPKKDDCIRRKRPLVLNLDGGDWDLSQVFLDKACVPEPGLEIVPMIEQYPFKVNGQTADVDTILAKYRRQYAFLKSQTVAGRPRFRRFACALSDYTQTDNYTLAEVRALFGPSVALGVEQGCFLFAPFSIGRRSGVLTYPEALWPCIDALAAAIGPQDPDLTAHVEDEMQKPEVTVSAWDFSKMKNGATMTFFDRMNPNSGTWTVVIRDGAMYFSCSNDVGEGHSGLPRLVQLQS